MSDAGDARPMFPPKVPKFRMDGDPKRPAASTNTGWLARTTEESSTARIVANAPIRKPPDSFTIPSKPAIRFKLTNAPGAKSPRFIRTNKSVPPAKGYAPTPSFAKTPTASDTVAGAKYVNGLILFNFALLSIFPYHHPQDLVKEKSITHLKEFFSCQ